MSQGASSPKSSRTIMLLHTIPKSQFQRRFQTAGPAAYTRKRAILKATTKNKDNRIFRYRLSARTLDTPLYLNMPPPPTQWFSKGTSQRDLYPMSGEKEKNGEKRFMAYSEVLYTYLTSITRRTMVNFIQYQLVFSPKPVHKVHYRYVTRLIQ